MKLDHPRYTSGEVLGEGAQGTVVRVIDAERPTAKLVAKVWRETARSAHIETEFALLARLRIPGLVRAHDLARDASGRAFLVEDLAEGDDASTWTAGDPSRIAALAAELAETLAMLHDAGFVHGDVKPANVRVSEGGRVKLIDLGAVVRRAEAARAFTPLYAAPEVIAGAPMTPASDLFALGATLHVCATRSEARPEGTRFPPLRERVPAMPPSLAAIVDALLAEHPGDRPATGRDVLAALGRELRTPFETGGRGAHVREAEVERLLASGAYVTYLVGPSGVGKSHVLREVATRALLAGRPARHVRFPHDDPGLVARLLGFFRTNEGWPWPRDGGLVLLDDLHAAPAELVTALAAYQCRLHGLRAAEAPAAIVAATRIAPDAVPTVTLGPLDGEAFERLCDELGVVDRAALAAESGGLPGWAVASVGRVPLTRDAALARAAGIDRAARETLALVACLGGFAPSRLVDPAAAAGAFREGLLAREGDRVRLATPGLAGDLAAALVDFAIADRAAAIVLADLSLGAAVALAVGSGATPPTDRARVLAEAAARARDEGSRAIEIEALLGLVAEASERTPARLVRLERLARDAGVARAHPRVLAWLEEASERAPELRSLALRRRADDRARAGATAEARALADRALEAATSPAERAWALATRGSVALFAASFGAADADLVRAHEMVRDVDDADAEENARLEHNLGVVALYRGRVDEAARAFEASLAIKRRLGDAAGARACLLNLGIAEGKRDRFDAAERALVEATALAEALGQKAGKGWCLAARADVAVRRGQPREVEAFVAEARALGDAVQAAVRAELSLSLAEAALLDGDGRAAQRALATLDPAIVDEDALVAARRLVIEGRSLLAALPVDRRAAARCGVQAIRRARAGELVEVEAEAVALVRAARKSKRARARQEGPMPVAKVEDEAGWQVVEALASAPLDEAAMLLAKMVLAEARAERVLVIAEQAWGVDIDGLAIASPRERVDADLLAAAKRSETLVYRPEVTTRAGRGSQLAAANDVAAIVIEHRFFPRAFDHVAEPLVRRWLALAALVARLARVDVARDTSATSVSRAGESVSLLPSMTTTSAPIRELRRDYPSIVGKSEPLRRALVALDAAVDSELPVLVRGETGTGKELFARALHDEGARARAPFVAVNCAAIADALFEAELFGHARGAFTGADRSRPGLIARAEGGTLFLDEIGELPLARQATLLRVLEQRTYRPVGADDERPFDVRIVTATNRDLDVCVEEGTFRRDLLYRLRVLDIAVPPLRARPGDVPLLVRHFLARAGARTTFTPAALATLEGYAFPGNVRELSHLVQRMAAQGATRIEPANLPRAVRARSPRAEARPEPEDAKAEVERALAETNGNISRAATLLGITRHGLKKRMLRLGVRARIDSAENG